MTSHSTISAGGVSGAVTPDSGERGSRPGGRWIVMAATNGSPAGVKATLLAVEHARALSAVLWIVQVLAPVEYRVGRLAPMRAVARPLGDPFDSPVLRDARALAWRNGVAASLQLMRGDPPPAILAAAVEHHADLLVIGARQHRQHRWPWPAQARTGRWIHQHASCQVCTPAHRGELAL